MLQHPNQNNLIIHSSSLKKYKTRTIVMFITLLFSIQPHIEQSNKLKLDNKIQLIINEIKELFKKGKFKNQQKFLKQKLQKDFNKKLELYVKLLQSRRSTKKLQLNALRQKRQTISLSNAQNNFKHNNNNNKNNNEKKDSDSEDQKQPYKIQLQQVNEQTLYYQRMIQLKQKQLLEVKDKMEAALTVQKDIGRLVNEQGEQLDIAEQNIDSARSNVKQAGELLEQGKKHHQSMNRKKMMIAGAIFLLLLIIIVPIVVKFT